MKKTGQLCNVDKNYKRIGWYMEVYIEKWAGKETIIIIYRADILISIIRPDLHDAFRANI